MRNLIIETSPMKGNSDRRLGSAEAVPQNILTLTHTQLTLTQNPIKKKTKISVIQKCYRGGDRWIDEQMDRLTEPRTDIVRYRILCPLLNQRQARRHFQRKTDKQTDV